jgi:hypothetical protein
LFNLTLVDQPREFFDDTIEESWRKKTVVHAIFVARDRAQIEARPPENIHLIEHDPRSLAIQSQVLLHAQRNLDGNIRIGRRRVRNRHHGNCSRSVA